MSSGETAPIYWDSRDLTPFGQPHLRTPVHDLAGGVGGLLTGVLGGRNPALLSIDGEVPRLKPRRCMRLSSRAANRNA